MSDSHINELSLEELTEVTLEELNGVNSHIIGEDSNSDDDDVASLDHISEDDNEEVRFYREKIAHLESEKMRKGKSKMCEGEAGNDNNTNVDPVSVTDPDFDVLEELRQCTPVADLDGYVSEDEDSDKGYKSHVYDSEDEHGCPKGKKWPVFYPKTKWDKQEPARGMLFKDAYELRHCITNYAIANGREIKFVKSSKNVVLARCKSGCKWRLYASMSQMNNSIQVKSYNPVHNQKVCVLDFGVKLVTSRWLAREYAKEIRENPNWKLVDFKQTVLQKHKKTVTKVQCYRAKMFGLGEIESVLVEHYARLWDYREELLRSNPGSTVVLEGSNVDGGLCPMFDKMYVCFDALKKGWLAGCRPVIGLDGCFLKNICRGQLLCAVGRDGNNHMFPIAWAVVHSESNETWTWFLQLLNQDIGYNGGHGLTFISDQQKGLLNGLSHVFPHAEHRNCARHIYANFRKHFNGVALRNLFWKAAKSSTEPEFLTVMAEIKKASTKAYEYLKMSKPEHWCRAFFSTLSSSENVENNLSETFNSCILEARQKPIIALLEEIRQAIMHRLTEKKQFLLSHDDDLCPRIRKKLEIAKDEFKHWHASSNGFGGFEVRKGLEGYTVDLNLWTCSCRMWQLSGIPCPHVVAAICFTHDNCDRFVSKWFLREETLKAYDYALQPVNGQNLWPKSGNVPLLPPKQRRKPGRPKKMRYKEWSERRGKNSKKKPNEPQNPFECSRKGRKMRCTNCNEWDHNARFCKNPRVEGDMDLDKRRKRNIGKRKRTESSDDIDLSGGGIPMEPSIEERGPMQTESIAVEIETKMEQPSVEKEAVKEVEKDHESVEAEKEVEKDHEKEHEQQSAAMKLPVRRGRPKKKPEHERVHEMMNSERASPLKSTTPRMKGGRVA